MATKKTTKEEAKVDVCPACKGTGRDTPTTTCPVCEGTGKAK